MEKRLEIKDYLEIIWRRKWFFIIPFVVMIIITGAYAKWTPRIYQASTLTLIEQADMAPEYVRPMLTENREDRFRTIEKQITSRHFIEVIVEEFDLLASLRKRPPWESVERGLRNRIKVKVSGDPVPAAFSISFEDRDPVIAMKIANRLTTLFIERAQRENEQHALETISFLDKELLRVKNLLAQQERKISQFKTIHLSGLSDDLTSRGGEVAPADITETDDLVVLYSLLSRLRLKYTDEHPEIIRLKAKIAEIEGKKSGMAKLEDQSNRENAKISQLQTEKNWLHVGQQLRELSRSYQATQNEYQSLLDKRFRAELAASVEQKQTGQRFQILDEARIPEEPFKPNIPNVFLVGLLLAMGAGVGLVAVTERFDTSFYKTGELENFTELPVIANISNMKKKTFYEILKKFAKLPVIASIFNIKKKGRD